MSGPKSGLTISIVNVIKNMVGSSILPMPYGVRLAGVVPSVVIALLSGILSTWTFGLMGELCESSAHTSYRALVEYYVDNRWGPWIDILVALYTFPSCLSYHVSVLGCMEAMLQSMTDPSNWDLWYMQRWFFSIVLSVVFVFPLCCTDKLHFLSYASVLGIAAILYCYVFVAVDLDSNSESIFIDQFESAIWWPPSGNVLAMLPIANIFAACYLAQYNAPTFYESLERKTTRRFWFVSNFSTGIVFLFCISFAIMGFARFGFTTPGNILLSYQRAYGQWIAISVSMIATYPLVFDAGRRAVITAVRFWSQRFPQKQIFWATNWTIVPLFTVVAIWLKDLETVVGLSGALLGNLVGFIIPGILLIYKNKVDGVADRFYHHNWLGWALVVIGAVLTVVGTAATFMSFD
jgi:amino acid permease